MLTIRLDAFGGDGEIERASERHDTSCNRGVLDVHVQSRNERAVDLQRVNRESLQIRKRRVAGAKVVDGQQYAHLLQQMEGLCGGTRVLHDGAFSNLQLHTLRGYARSADDLRDVVDQ